MAKEILVVIGTRLGKGQAIARGVDLGISQCGSGGAGALAASNKYGWKSKYGMRSVDAACTAVKDGCKVVGTGFLDTEELGEKLVEAWREANPDA